MRTNRCGGGKVMGTVGPPRTSSPSSGCKHRRARRIAGFILGDIVGPVRADSSVVRALPDGRPTRALGFECGLQLLMRPRRRASLPGSAEKPSPRPAVGSSRSAACGAGPLPQRGRGSCNHEECRYRASGRMEPCAGVGERLQTSIVRSHEAVEHDCGRIR